MTAFPKSILTILTMTTLTTLFIKKCGKNLVVWIFIANFAEKARLLFEQERISEGHYVELLNLLKL